MTNDITIKGGHPISENLSTVVVGDQTTCLEISDKNGARVTGDLEVTGDIRGNITDIVFDDITTGDIVCDSITIDDIAIDVINEMREKANSRQNPENAIKSYSNVFRRAKEMLGLKFKD